MDAGQKPPGLPKLGIARRKGTEDRHIKRYEETIKEEGASLSPRLSPREKWEKEEQCKAGQ